MSEIEERASPPTSTPWVPVYGGAGLVYKGDWVAGTYLDGDIVVKDGVAFMCAGGPTAVAPEIGPWGTAAAPRSYDSFFANFNGPWQDAVPTAADGTSFFVATAGNYLLHVGASWYHASAGAVRSVDVYLDGVYLLTLDQWLNQGSLHMTCNPKSALVSLTAGTHKIALRHIGGSASDTGDRAFLTGVPWASAVALGGGGAGAAPSYGTTLPANPVDGQEAILVDSLTNPTYSWRFRYNAASASAYKWEFIGGSPGKHELTGSVSISGGAYGDSSSVGPSFTFPRAGEYLLEFGSTAAEFGDVNIVYMSPSIGGVAAVDANAAQNRSYGAGGGSDGLFALKSYTVTAGQAVVFKYKVFATSVTLRDRFVKVTPTRVA